MKDFIAEDSFTLKACYLVMLTQIINCEVNQYTIDSNAIKMIIVLNGKKAFCLKLTGACNDS